MSDAAPAAAPPGARLLPPDPRDAAVEAAAADLRGFLDGWVKTHRLTVLEYLYILGVCQHRQVQAMCVHERQVQRGPEVVA